MSSTEQKNCVQTFISSCFTFGILPTITSGAFTDYGLDTDSLPFNTLGATPNLKTRLQRSPVPLEDVRRIIPILTRAPHSTRVAPLLTALCSNSTIYYSNQGIMRFCEAVASDRYGLRFTETPAIKHARRHAAKTSSMLSPGSYGEASRTGRNVEKITHRGDGFRCRAAADVIEYLAYNLKRGAYNGKVRKWCAENRESSNYEISYRSDKAATADYAKANPHSLDNTVGPPELKQKLIYSPRFSQHRIAIYRCGHFTIFRVTSRSDYSRWKDAWEERDHTSGETSPDAPHGLPKSEIYVFDRRDLDDLRFLLHACSNTQAYLSRREYDCPSPRSKTIFRQMKDSMWSGYLNVMRYCGVHYDCRNKLGVYFDVLQWRYLAWKSGDEFYDHSRIMGQKVESKGLSKMPSQTILLDRLKRMEMDVAVDLLGIYKASIYPEVDPFKVVGDQHRLHYSRFDTDWEPSSDEAERFRQTKAYMWYFGTRVIWKRMAIWPGKIREGVEAKDWHARYKTRGIPGRCWMDACDIDLTGAIPVADISNEQYMRQQDSACAPPRKDEYSSFESLQKAPRYHRRKILYAIQETKLPDLPTALEQLNSLGRSLSEGHIDKVDIDLGFSTDIVTGSRCERHKDAPRPFYAASSPWGCILSYFDGITRDFLSNVSQNLLGKSTRQKFIDISTAASYEIAGTQAFFMSDDKAKYSPRMDPNSQQLPADFFSELFDIPGMKAFGPIMYHCDLYYRVCGHLVSYNSNGTDREGMRGASNTWLEIIAQGLSTRLCRDRKIVHGKSTFLAFIDDGLRKFAVPSEGKSDEEVRDDTKAVISDVIFGLRVLGRELSWDKTFISSSMFVILNELMYDGAHISSGLKSFCTAGDLEMKEVMSASDFEQLHFGKMRGAHSVGAPLDLCHHHYIFDVLMSHYKMGVNLQDNKQVNNIEYRLFCITPVALGGGGLRGMAAMGSNEVANTTKECIGNLTRLSRNVTILSVCIETILDQEIEGLNPIDFMREPEQMHVTGPRIKTQRLAAEVRKRLGSIAGNDVSRRYIQQDKVGLELLEDLGKAMLSLPSVSAEDIRLLYALSPVAFIDEFIQKLASSTTLSSILGPGVISGVRRAVRRDLVESVHNFRMRCRCADFISELRGEAAILASLSYFMC